MVAYQKRVFIALLIFLSILFIASIASYAEITVRGEATGGISITNNVVKFYVNVDEVVSGPEPCTYYQLLVKADLDAINRTINFAGHRVEVHGYYYSGCHIEVVESYHYVKVLDGGGTGNDPPVADFSYSPSNPNVGETVRFTDQSYDPDGYIEEWHWDFDDGHSSSSQNPSHTYSGSGDYYVCLTVWDNDGDSDESCRTVSVSGGGEANFVITDMHVPATAEVGEHVSISVTVTNQGTKTGAQPLKLEIKDSSGRTVVDSTTIPFTLKPGRSYRLRQGYSFSQGIYTVTYSTLNDSRSMTIEIETKANEPPVAKLSASPTVVGIGESVSFDASNSYDPDGSVKSYYFEFGDGGSSGWESNPSTTHHYAESGTYYARLKVKDNEGTESNWSISVKITVEAKEQGEKIKFQGIITDIMQWDIYMTIPVDVQRILSGPNINGEIPVHIGYGGHWYPAPPPCHGHQDSVDVGDRVEVYGEYHNDKNMVSICSSSNYYLKKIENEPPVADFTWDPLEPKVDETVEFTDQSTDPDGDITSWTWDFDDGNTSTQQNPTHSFTSPGTYNVCLTVEDSKGNTDTECKDISVEGKNEKPIAKLSAYPTDVDVGDTVTLIARDSYDPDGTVESYYYDFGDGETSGWISEEDTGHEYSSAGTYYARVKVKDNEGTESEWSDSVEITAGKGEKPTAKIVFYPTDPKVDEEITFDGSKSSDPDGEIAKYEWDFGDGATGTGKVVKHSYSQEGTYTIVLTVTDNDGLKDQATQQVTVQGSEGEHIQPKAAFTWSPNEPQVGEDVQFTDQSTYDPEGMISKWEWEFGDGNTSGSQNPVHTYFDPGTYEVCLTVTDVWGQKDKVCQKIEVKSASATAIDAEITTFRITDPNYQEKKLFTPGEKLTLGVKIKNIGELKHNFLVGMSIGTGEEWFDYEEGVYASISNPCQDVPENNMSMDPNAWACTGVLNPDTETVIYISITFDLKPTLHPEDWTDIYVRVFKNEKGMPVLDTLKRSGAFKVRGVLEPDTEFLSNLARARADRTDLILRGAKAYVEDHNFDVLLAEDTRDYFRGLSDETIKFLTGLQGRVKTIKEMVEGFANFTDKATTDWAESGTATCLQELLKKRPVNLAKAFEDLKSYAQDEAMQWRRGNKEAAFDYILLQAHKAGYIYGATELMNDYTYFCKDCDEIKEYIRNFAIGVNVELAKLEKDYSERVGDVNREYGGGRSKPKKLHPWSCMSAASPVNLHAYDSSGRHVGVNESGGVDLEIPGASYSGPDAHPEWIAIMGDVGNIRYEIESTGSGTANIQLKQVKQGRVKDVTFSNISINKSTKAQIDVDPDNPDYTMEVDEDGDGVTDQVVEPEVKEIGEEIQRGEIKIHHYPNPARNSATFKYTLPEGVSNAMLRVYDIAGRLVYETELSIYSEEHFWDLMTFHGKLANGLYFYFLTAINSDGQVSRSDIKRLVVHR